jgi:GNAT superfamily N-acetyltransferase
MTPTGSMNLTVREYAERDEHAVLELLRAALGEGPTGNRSPEFFRWKHLMNPFGRTFMLVAEEGGRIVGLRAFMRWEFIANDATFRAVRAVDTATHPDFQGRGIFKRLTLEALDALRGDVDFVFNTPNAQSLPGYLKMGWSMVGRLPVWVRVRRPVRFVRGLRHLDGPPAHQALFAAEAPSVLQDTGVMEGLMARVGRPSERFSTNRSARFLSWRYAAASGLGYRGIADVDGNGSVRGVAIFRVRQRGRLLEATLAEVLAPWEDRATTARLLRRVARETQVDHVATHLAAGSSAARAAATSGFVRAPQGITFVARPLREGIAPDLGAMRSWALSLGDVEVF